MFGLTLLMRWLSPLFNLELVLFVISVALMVAGGLLIIELALSPFGSH